MLLPVFFKILLFLLFQPADLVRIDLGGGNQSEWIFYSRLVNISGKARVPGDIFADLQANHLIGDPLYGDGDLLYRWVGHQDWTYQRPIRLPMEAHNATFLLLHFHGLDGPCSIQINGRHLATVDNQFRSHTFDAKPFLTLGLNFLAIDFQSPVNAAKAKAENYRMLNLHALPPECPPPVQHGECHVNQLRKMQASFSWDWGPSLPGVGIWRPVELQYFDNLSILRWSPVVLPGGDAHFLINASLSLLCSPAIPQIGVELSLPQLGLAKHFQIQLNAGACHPRLELGSLQLLVPRHKVQLWWLRGYGRQPLYRLQLVVTGPNGQVLDKAHKRIAFRTVQLNQTPLNSSDPTRGRLFQFEVNGKPVFLKGTNWAPISAFAGRQHSRRRRFLFHSMVAANMNALRVWGGGFYEEEEFYDLADRLGLLIWQDFMFACALYPTDAAFLRSVQAEVEEQVLRLRHHPSVLCWAGNNENELAIRSHWYPEPNYPEEAQARDYLVLYKASIQPLVRALDPSRPFLLSSPSNGAETERQGGIARKPGDPACGDIHFYTEAENLWQDSTFPVPRCASEFGTQSIPMRATMLRWLPEADWSYGSRAMVRRQHHPGGILSLPAMALQHFPLPLSTGNFTANSSLVDQLAFLTQAHQAIALQAQIEHYRRWRSRLADGTAGLGRTMCALYWQLNDVWAAPSWSTVDFDLRWKLGHNQVRRSFAPLIVSMFLDTSASADGQLRLFVVSDLLDSTRKVNIQLDVFVLRMGFRPLFSERIPLTEVPAQTAFEVPIPVLGRLPRFGQSAANEEEYLVAATLLDAKSGQPLSPKAILLPDKLRHIGKYGTAKLTHFAKIKTGSEDFELTVEADGILPLVWLQLSDQFTQAHPEVLYHFEENAFAMASPEQNATLRLFSNPRGASIEAGDIQILLL